jgi:hypothetical protein
MMIAQDLYVPIQLVKVVLVFLQMFVNVMKIFIDLTVLYFALLHQLVEISEHVPHKESVIAQLDGEVQIVKLQFVNQNV